MDLTNPLNPLVNLSARYHHADRGDGALATLDGGSGYPLADTVHCTLTVEDAEMVELTREEFFACVSRSLEAQGELGLGDGVGVLLSPLMAGMTADMVRFDCADKTFVYLGVDKEGHVTEVNLERPRSLESMRGNQEDVLLGWGDVARALVTLDSATRFGGSVRIWIERESVTSTETLDARRGGLVKVHLDSGHRACAVEVSMPD